MSHPVQFFIEPHPLGGGTLYCLDNHGAVWRRRITGFGDNGRGWPPRNAWWEPAEGFVPPLDRIDPPKEGGM